MRLNDIESKQLLPRFAHVFDWVQNAFDSIVKAVFARAKGIDAPLTMESIQALSDSELQALYEQYGIAQYYPDLSRETRDKMLYEMCRIYRYLGTPKAVEILCNYIFDGVQLDLKVLDNLAFDEYGNLIDSDLLDVFDIQIDPLESVLSEDANARILANVIRFSRNSQYLRAIYYDFPENFDCTVQVGIDPDNPCVIVDFEQDSICDPVTPQPPIKLYAYWGDTVTIPSGYRIESITANVAYTFAKYKNISGGVTLVLDGKNVYTDQITSAMLPNYPPSAWPVIEVFKGYSIDLNQTPRMQGYALTEGRTTGGSPGFTVTEADVNGTSVEYGDYFILLKGTTYSGAIESTVMSKYPARLFWQIDNLGNVEPEAFKLPQTLWKYENGVFSWLGDTTDDEDLAYYYANDWNGQIRFNINCV